MNRFLSVASMMLAWACAQGAIWDVVQMVAWARMFANNAQTMPVATALATTFDGSRPCELCTGVALAKDIASKQAPQGVERSAEKLQLACEVPTPFTIKAPIVGWPDPTAPYLPLRTEQVPVPPPRA